MIPVALTVAGSDPSGGAGIQADLRAFNACGVYGVSAITALTVQTPGGVSQIIPVDAAAVAAQVEAMIESMSPRAIKTGMLWSRETIEALAETLTARWVGPLVVDPVLQAKGGERLLSADAVDALRQTLFPLAEVITPNCAEAESLTGMHITNESEAAEAARTLRALGPRTVVVTGGAWNEQSVDVVYDGTDVTTLVSDRVVTEPVHGTGCLFASAIAAHLALGRSTPDALQAAKGLIAAWIRSSVHIGPGARVAPVAPISEGG